VSYRLKDKNENNNTEKSTSNWARRFAKEKVINISPEETLAMYTDIAALPCISEKERWV